MTHNEYSFNLIDEPWVPCVTDKGIATDLSLRDVFSNARDIREITDASPVVTVALHRLLLAILHRSLRGPETPEDWHSIWSSEGWETPRIAGYLDRWQPRFDLFDAERPFYQNGNIGFDEAKPMGYMVHGMVVGNNATLFDHSTDAQPPAFPPAAAARYLVALQGFALGGFVSSVKGEDRGKVGSADASPLSRGIVTLVTGDNLFETLMLNWLQYSPESQIPFPVKNDDADEDKPAWERDEPTRPQDRNPDGYVDLLTWQSRRARLQPERDADGSVVVRRASVMKGYQFGDGWQPWDTETMLAFRKILKPTATQAPYGTLSFNEARALWRDSDSLFGAVVNTSRPRTIEWIGTLARSGYLPKSAQYQVSALGVLSDRKSIAFWRAERLPLPANLVDNTDLLAWVERALKLAERCGRLFHAGFDDDIIKVEKGKKINVPRPMQLFAATLLAPGGDRSPERGDIDNLIASLDTTAGYWPRLEAPFKEFLRDLPKDGGGESFPRWVKVVHDTARDAFGETMQSFDLSARELKAGALAKSRFDSSLAVIVKDFQPEREEETHEETITATA